MPPKRRHVQATGPLCFRRPRLVLQLDSFADWLDKCGAATPNREPLVDQIANLRQAVVALDMPRRRHRCVTVVPLATMRRKEYLLRKALRREQEKFCAFKGAKDQHRVQLNTFVRVTLADPALSERRLEELARRWTLDEEEEVVVGRSTIGSIRNGLVEFLFRQCSCESWKSAFVRHEHGGHVSVGTHGQAQCTSAVYHHHGAPAAP